MMRGKYKYPSTTERVRDDKKASMKRVVIVEDATQEKPKHIIDLSKPEIKNTNETTVCVHGIGGVLFRCEVCRCEYTVTKDTWKTIQGMRKIDGRSVFTDIYIYKCPECGVTNETYKEWIDMYLASKENKYETPGMVSPPKPSLFRRVINFLTMDLLSDIQNGEDYVK